MTTAILDKNWEARFKIECRISNRVVKTLKLRSLAYKYEGKLYKVPMLICVKDFLDGLTLKSDINEALQRIAIEGPCEFTWPAGYWDRRGYWQTKMDSPTWEDIFRVANHAYIDGRCVDHHFLENFHKDTKTGKYEFFFGS